MAHVAFFGRLAEIASEYLRKADRCMWKSVADPQVAGQERPGPLPTEIVAPDEAARSRDGTANGTASASATPARPATCRRHTKTTRTALAARSRR